MAKVEDIHKNDKCQVSRSAVDITNGVKAGTRYVEGSSEWGYIQLVDPKWLAAFGENKGKFVQKVRILGVDNKTVVWQVEPHHVADNIIHMNNCGPQQAKAPDPLPVEVREVIEAPSPIAVRVFEPEPPPTSSGELIANSFVTTPTADTWKPKAGNTKQALPVTSIESGLGIPPVTRVRTFDTVDIYSSLVSLQPSRFEASNSVDSSKLPPNVRAAKDIEKITQANDQKKVKLMLNDEPSVIQNIYGYPARDTSANYTDMIPARYDYRIDLRDHRYGLNVRLEDQLQEARAAFGLPVHGSNDMAKLMKYYLYNRFKVPDTNLAHNRSFTHVFFTRPDLNILTGNPINPTITPQCANHTESAMLWLRNPLIFKMLVDNKRCGDSNNFNMPLSNAIQSISVEDERLSHNESTANWNEYAMQYGDAYDGRTAGTLTITFLDDKILTIMNMLKLWISYIDNVARGAWVPAYQLLTTQAGKPHESWSHVFTKTLDYAASIYLFRVGEDGSDIIYWSKYYGIFPLSTGSSAMSWDISQTVGESPKLNIPFRYSYKKDFSPVSLLEFNAASNATNYGLYNNQVSYEEQWNSRYNHSHRPYTGAPFVQISMPSKVPSLNHLIDGLNNNIASLRLQFKPDTSALGSNMDSRLYRPRL